MIKKNYDNKLDFIVNHTADIHTDIKESNKQIQHIAVDMAKTREHMKALNGKVQRHEESIDNAHRKINENKVSLAKVGGAGAGAGGLVLLLWESIRKFMGN